MSFDGKAFGKEIVDTVKGHIDRSLAPLNARIDAMEKAISSLPVPKDGKDADVEEIAALAAASLLPDLMEVRAMVDAMPAAPDVPGMIAEAIAAIPVPKDGKSITIDDVAPMIKAEAERIGASILDAAKASVAELVAAIPPAANGKDADPELIKQMVTEAIAALPPAEKGKDADPVEVAAQIATEVERAVAALPVPKDGQSITLDDMRPLIDEAVTKAVTLIPVPKNGKDGRDGLDVVKFIRDDRGHLNGILRDGTTVDLGEYVGKDGAPGKDGTDGVGFDDMEFVHDGERTFTFRFAKGDRTVEKSFDVPMMIYRGVYREGEKYKQGDTCTWGGHLWHCDTATKDKPDGKDRCWSMAVRKGKDGKDGELKPPTKPGPVKAG